MLLLFFIVHLWGQYNNNISSTPKYLELNVNTVKSVEVKCVFTQIEVDNFNDNDKNSNPLTDMCRQPKPGIVYFTDSFSCYPPPPQRRLWKKSIKSMCIQRYVVITQGNGTTSGGALAWSCFFFIPAFHYGIILQTYTDVLGRGCCSVAVTMVAAGNTANTEYSLINVKCWEFWKIVHRNNSLRDYSIFY